MKKFLFLLFVIFSSTAVFAQLEVKPGSFKEVHGFVNTNPDPNYQTDDNELPFAVIKVRTENITDKQRKELIFEGNAGTFIMLEYKVGEVWVYLTAKYADYLKISHPEYSSVEYTLPCDLVAKHGYELTLVNTPSIGEDLLKRVEKLENAGVVAQITNQVGYITVKSIPKGADVLVDNVKVGVTPYLSEEIGVGNHKISVSMDGYEPAARRVEISGNKEIEVSFKLNKEDNIIESQISERKELEPQLNRNSQVSVVSVTNFVNGLFSVYHNKQITFSQGNLQYQASTNTWRFADNQWDIVGEDNKNIAATDDVWIDLFGWGTGDNPSKSTTNNSDYSTFNDWGNNIIINGNNKTWRTLTKDEYDYVFNLRETSSGIRYAKATIEGVNGVVLLPDNWDSMYYELNNVNVSTAEYSSNEISLTDWINKFESNGAILLPAAGCRYGLSVNSINTDGNYWAAPDDKERGAFRLLFRNDNLNLNDYYKSYGRSVRLVCDAE